FQIWNLKLAWSPAFAQSRYVGSIDALRQRRQGPLCLQTECRLSGQELLHHSGVLFRLETARAVNQGSARLEPRGGAAQHGKLHAAQTLNLSRLNAPAQLDAPPHHPGVRARWVN